MIWHHLDLRQPGRLPTLSWCNGSNFASLWRCAQPMEGLLGQGTMNMAWYLGGFPGLFLGPTSTRWQYGMIFQHNLVGTHSFHLHHLEGRWCSVNVMFLFGMVVSQTTSDKTKDIVASIAILPYWYPLRGSPLVFSQGNNLTIVEVSHVPILRWGRVGFTLALHYISRTQNVQLFGGVIKMGPADYTPICLKLIGIPALADLTPIQVAG